MKTTNDQAHTPQERKIGRRNIAIGAVMLALQIGLMTWVMSDDSHESSRTKQSPSQSSAQEFGPRPAPEPTITSMRATCQTIVGKALKWQSRNYEINFGPEGCNGTLTFTDLTARHRGNKLTRGYMPVKLVHNEADVTITLGKPDHPISAQDKHTPRPGTYFVELRKHTGTATFTQLLLSPQADHSIVYTLCSPWRANGQCDNLHPRA